MLRGLEGNRTPNLLVASELRSRCATSPCYSVQMLFTSSPLHLFTSSALPGGGTRNRTSSFRLWRPAPSHLALPPRIPTTVENRNHRSKIKRPHPGLPDGAVQASKSTDSNCCSNPVMPDPNRSDSAKSRHMNAQTRRRSRVFHRAGRRARPGLSQWIGLASAGIRLCDRCCSCQSMSAILRHSDTQYNRENDRLSRVFSRFFLKGSP
jgi:hypothetical protein